eukprot:TRINITY_DN138_c0_g3_i1.p1 TRINITY_DN138_c0_g3~~TRINITY_DN138_c0_g3_i1.p1  ORF type:complete len:773 (+),score=261.21 TRINITY_DN138_c0_g3_i1:45-2321(+)
MAVGRSLLMLLGLLGVAQGLPNGYVWGCYNISKSFPFCDSSLDVEHRLDDLLNRMTIDEMIGLMSPWVASGVGICNFMDAGVPRLGIPPYMHLVEFNTGVASACYGEDKCATNFPGPTGLGASYNRTLWNMKGAVMSDEMRAFNNLNWHRGTPDAPLSLIALTGYGPNININRDPRWGRNSEVPSEDPFLAGTYAENYVRGGQVGSDPRYTKVAMGLKHFAVYSMETNRQAFIPNVSMHDLWETFLPGYRLGFSPEHGNASLTMCSYAGINGVPSCANGYLLSLIRKTFNNPDVVVGSDCGAFYNMLNSTWYGNHYAKDIVDMSNLTLSAGADQELGDSLWGNNETGGNDGLSQLVSIDPSAPGKIRASVRRSLKLRFKTGMFDPVEGQPYTQIGAEAINATLHQQINLEAAQQSFVLLKNTNNVLPIGTSKKLAIVGPHIVSQRDLMSDYASDNVCLDTTYSCIPTIGGVFAQRYPQGNLLSAQGCDLNSTNASAIPDAVNAAKAADVTIMFLGLGHDQEHEGEDRMEVTLPGQQLELFSQVLAVGKPLVVVLINGGQLSIGSVKDQATAIVEAFYPSTRGPDALFNVLIEGVNNFGKMPYTVMPAEDVYALDLANFNMSKPPGRTYKYYQNTPEWEFGYGLSYTNFSISCSLTAAPTSPTISIQNVGPVDGSEVIMVFHRVSDQIRASAPHPVPKKELIDFQRVAVGKSATETVTFNIPQSAFAVVDQNGNQQVYKGTHYLDFTNGVFTCTGTYNI